MGFIPFIIIFGTLMGIIAGFMFTLGVRFPMLTVLLEKDKRAANERQDTAKGLCIGLAILFGVAAFFIAIYSVYFVSSGIRTQGIITEIRETKDDKGAPRYTPYYKYSDKKGGAHLDSANMRTGTEYKIGDTVPVIYLADAPSNSRIDGFLNHWFAPIWLVSMAFGAGMVPSISHRISKRKPVTV